MKNGIAIFALCIFSSITFAEDRLIDNLTIKNIHERAVEARRNRGLKDLELDEDCCRISQRWAEVMASSNSMYHGGGENIIAYGNLSEDGVVRMWLNSGPHAAFVLGNYAKVGWGVAKSASGTLYWAGTFRGSDGVTYYSSGTSNYSTNSRRLFRRR